MHRVKIFDCTSCRALQEEVNAYLEDMSQTNYFELVDIKFNTYTYGKDEDYHAAMVIYKI